MSRTVVVGSNRGIGLELVRQCKERGDEVLGACRTASAELKATGAELLDGIDVATDEGPAKLAAALDGRKVDLLICNAGIMRNETLENLDLATLRAQMEVNALGPLRTVHALLGNLDKGAKVGLVTSRMGSIADNDSGSRYGYRMSKAALNMAGKCLSVDLASAGVSVAILHPGFVMTDMTGGAGNLTAAESATGLLARLDELKPKTSGTFWHAQGQVLPW